MCPQNGTLRRPLKVSKNKCPGRQIFLECRNLKKDRKSAENRRKVFFRSEGYGEIFEKYFVGYTARSYSQLCNFLTHFLDKKFACPYSIRSCA
jgi:hypothetical protein